MADNQQPTYQAYTVIKKDGSEDWWCAIGSAWQHRDGQGLNILLHALPVNGKIVLRPPKDKEDEPPARETPRRDNNRDRRKDK